METKKESFAGCLADNLRNYQQPFEVLDKLTESYIRQRVSAFNTANGTTFGLFNIEGKRFVATRSDYRNIKVEPAEPETIRPGSTVQFETMDANDHLKAAVELFRSEGLNGDEMRLRLNSLLTDNDDIL